MRSFLLKGRGRSLVAAKKAPYCLTGRATLRSFRNAERLRSTFPLCPTWPNVIYTLFIRGTDFDTDWSSLDARREMPFFSSEFHFFNWNIESVLEDLL